MKNKELSIYLVLFVVLEHINLSLDTFLIAFLQFFLILGIFKATSNFVKTISYVSILYLGEWTYVIYDNSSFYNIRILGISIVTLAFLAVFLARIKRHKIYFSCFIFFLILISFVLNDIELVLYDLKKYAPLIIIGYVIYEHRKIFDDDFINCAVYLTVFSFIISLLFDIRMSYAEGHEYIPMSSAAYLFIPLLLVSSLNTKAKILLTIAYSFLSLFGLLLLTGKIIIISIISIGWFWLTQKKRYILLLPVFIFVTASFVNFEITDTITLYKIAQLTQLFSLDLLNIATLQSSVGNIIAEFLTLFNDVYINWYRYILPPGFGYGLSDQFNLLQIMVLKGGYPQSFLDHDSFLALHLTLLNLILKLGIVIPLILLLFNLRRPYLLLPFIIILLVGDANKETFIMCTALYFYLMGKNKHA